MWEAVKLVTVSIPNLCSLELLTNVIFPARVAKGPGVPGALPILPIIETFELGHSMLLRIARNAWMGVRRDQNRLESRRWMQEF